MAKDLNQVVLIGRLVRDPEIKYTPSGTAITKFAIANNDTFTVNNETKEHVNFFDTVVWGNQAVNCEKYLKKGSQVAIEGYLRQNRWADQNGQNRSKIEIVANRVQFLTPIGQAVNSAAAPVQRNQQVNNPNFNQNPNQGSGTGFIEDPWGDQGGQSNSGYSDPYSQHNESDDDIPF